MLQAIAYSWTAITDRHLDRYSHISLLLDLIPPDACQPFISNGNDLILSHLMPSCTAVNLFRTMQQGCDE